jgi:hypothetical protein
MKTSLVFLYRVLMIALLAWIAYTQTLIYRGRPVPVIVRNEPIEVEGKVEVDDNQPVKVEIDGRVEVEDAFPLQVQIVR